MAELDSKLIKSLAEPLELEHGDYSDFDSFKKSLSEKINHLINTDFEKLVQLLYRIDIHEKKLKAFLNDLPETNTAEIITDLMIERQLEKIETRRKYRQRNDISENDKW